jgi:hypothetical protein
LKRGVYYPLTTRATHAALVEKKTPVGTGCEFCSFKIPDLSSSKDGQGKLSESSIHGTLPIEFNHTCDDVLTKSEVPKNNSSVFRSRFFA